MRTRRGGSACPAATSQTIKLDLVDRLATYWLSEAGATAFEVSAITTLEPGQQN